MALSNTSGDVERPDAAGGVEQPRPFLATPDRVSQYLELKHDEVTAQMKSIEGRQQLYDQLMEHEESLRADHADFDPSIMRNQLDVAGDSLLANERYLQDIRSPEKKNVMRRAWDSVKGFVKKHPVVTTLLAASLVAGGVAGTAYMVGGWEALMAKVGIGHLWGAAGAGEAAEALGPLIDGAQEIPNYFEGPVGPDQI